MCIVSSLTSASQYKVTTIREATHATFHATSCTLSSKDGTGIPAHLSVTVAATATALLGKVEFPRALQHKYAEADERQKYAVVVYHVQKVTVGRVDVVGVGGVVVERVHAVEQVRRETPAQRAAAAGAAAAGAAGAV